MNFDVVSKDLDIQKYGKILYLLGSAEYGPIFESKKVISLQDVYDKYGTSGTLIEAYKQIYNTSMISDIDVYMTKVTGEHSIGYMNLNVKGEQPREDSLVIRAVEANPLYNSIYIEIDIDSITFVLPSTLGKPITYNFDDYEILGLLVRAINGDTKKGINFVTVSTDVDHSTPLTGLIYPVNKSIINLGGGNNGLVYSKNYYYLKLQEIYNILESNFIDIIIPLDACIDDIHPKFYYGEDYYNISYYTDDRDYLDLTDSNDKPLMFHKQLLDFCRNQTFYGFITHGIMGFSKLSNVDIDDINNNKLNYLDVIKASPLGTRQGFTKDIGIDDSFFISIVAGEIQINDIISNGYILYGVLMAYNTIAKSLTNKTMGSDSLSIITRFNTEQLSEMSSLGATTFRNSVLKGPVIYNAVTPVLNNESDFHYSCNVRMIQLCLLFLKINLDKYLGKTVQEVMKNNVIDEEIKNTLQRLVELEVLKNFYYTINIDNKKGIIEVQLQLTAIYMIESITTSIKSRIGGVG